MAVQIVFRGCSLSVSWVLGRPDTKRLKQGTISNSFFHAVHASILCRDMEDMRNRA